MVPGALRFCWCHKRRDIMRYHLPIPCLVTHALGSLQMGLECAWKCVKFRPQLPWNLSRKALALVGFGQLKITGVQHTSGMILPFLHSPSEMKIWEDLNQHMALLFPSYSKQLAHYQLVQSACLMVIAWYSTINSHHVLMVKSPEKL